MNVKSKRLVATLEYFATYTHKTCFTACLVSMFEVLLLRNNLA